MRKPLSYKLFFCFVLTLLVKTVLFSQGAIIAGKVKCGKEALQLATVSLGNKTVLTNYNGEFSLSVKPGSYTLTITHTGYKKIERIISVVAGSANSFDFDLVPNDQLGDVVVLGSRSLVQRSNLNTPFPVDAFSSAQLQETGQTSLMQMLNFTAPSLNASLQNFFEPVTLRGLSPGHVLILLNGTRYNNTAYINFGDPRGQLGKGSVTNDLNTIPVSAIAKVEILRDGATAQYGSDAIAGVINIVLKESTRKTSVNLHLGQQYEGDGENMRLGFHHGVALKMKGFLNFSADLRYRQPTFRGGEHKGTVYYPVLASYSLHQQDSIIALDNQKIKERGFDRMKVSNAGYSKLTSFGLLVNGGYPVNTKTEVFWTVSMNNLAFDFEWPHILPKAAAQVNTELFPDGFKPIVKPNAWNMAGIAGAKGVLGRGIRWEYSSSYGMNAARFKTENTNNASQQYMWGKNAPTKFYTGTFIYQQLSNAIHFIKNIAVGGDKLKAVSLGWGADLRFENYKTKAGEEASWSYYDSTFRKQGSSQISVIVTPNDAVNKNRSVWGAYLDLEGEFDDKLLLNVAGRFENYSDFGSNLAGKVAARYKLFDKLSLRGSLSNGFRAPSMQQRYYSSILSANSRRIAGVSTPITRGIFSNDHKVTKLFGVPSLEPEKSLNVSVGLTSTISRHIYLTIDAYWIQIKDRVVISGVFDRLTNPEVDKLLKHGSLNDYSYIDQVVFFTNAINSRTQGLDAVLHGKWNLRKARLTAVVSANFTKTRVFGEIKTADSLSATTENKNTLFNREERKKVERGQPNNKVIFSLNYKREKIGFMLRNTRFGETAFHRGDAPPESFGAKILTDVSTSWSLKSWLNITMGINNVFDVYPDRMKHYENTAEGRYIYATEASPFGFMGGYYYISMSFNF